MTRMPFDLMLYISGNLSSSAQRLRVKDVYVVMSFPEAVSLECPQIAIFKGRLHKQWSIYRTEVTFMKNEETLGMLKRHLRRRCLTCKMQT